MQSDSYEGILEALAKPSSNDFCGRTIELPFIHVAATEFKFMGYQRQDDEQSVYSSHYSELDASFQDDRAQLRRRAEDPMGISLVWSELVFPAIEEADESQEDSDQLRNLRHHLRFQL